MTKEELALLVRKPINELDNVSGIPDGKVPFYTGDGIMKLMDISNLNNLAKTAKTLAPTDIAPTVEGLYKPTISGTYTNAGGLIAQEEYDTLFFLNGTTWTKSETKMPQAQAKIKEFVDLIFPISNNEQTIYNNKYYRLKDSKTANITDLPTNTPSLWDEISAAIGLVKKDNKNAVSGDNVFKVIDNNIILGDNLIDTNGQFRGGNYLPTGAFTASVNWLSLLPIIVDGEILKENEVYTLNGSGKISSSNARIIFINAGGSAISSIMGDGISGASANYKVFTIPTGTKQILINVNQGTGTGTDPSNTIYKDTLMINSGDVVGIPYSKYGYKLNLKVNQAFISTTGLDTNRGTKLSPLKTIAGAKKILDPNGELIFLGGDYFDFVFDPSAFRVIKGNRGEKIRFIYGDVINSATLVSGYTKVYSAPYIYTGGTWQNVFSIWQHDISDVNSEIQIEKRHVVHKGLRYRLPSTRLKSVTSIDKVESSPVPCYFFNGTTMYFQKVAGSDLSINPIRIPKNTGVSGSDIKTVDHSNFSFLYTSFRTANLSGTISNVDVLFVNNLDGCFYTSDSISIDLKNCRAGGGSNDGFNGTGPIVTNSFNNYNKINLINCWSHDNVDDAESHHLNSEVFARGGLYEYSGSGCTPAVGCHAVYEDVTVQNCTITGFQAQGASQDGGIGTNIHCYGCVSESNGKNFEGRGLDSRFVNCVSITPTISHYSGTYRKLNSVEI